MKTWDKIKIAAAVVVMVGAVITSPYLAITCICLGATLGTLNATKTK